MFSQLISLVIVMLTCQAILTGACKRKHPLSIPTFQLLFMSAEKNSVYHFQGCHSLLKIAGNLKIVVGNLHFPSSQCIEILQNEVRA